MFRGEDDLHARSAGRGAAAAPGHEPTPHSLHAYGEGLALELVRQGNTKLTSDLRTR